MNSANLYQAYLDELRAACAHIDAAISLSRQFGDAHGHGLLCVVSVPVDFLRDQFAMALGQQADTAPAPEPPTSSLDIFGDAFN